MGYYTDYNLSVFQYPENIFWENLPWEKLNAAVDDIDGGIFEKWTQGEWNCNAKWYSQDADMWKLSVQFPDILFLLHGDGDEADDVWDEYWQNGCMQHCHMKIPPYKESEMKRYTLNSGGQLVADVAFTEDDIGEIKLPDL